MRNLLRNIYLNIFGTFKKPKSGIHIINSHFVTPGKPSKADWILFEDFLLFLSSMCELIHIQDAVKQIYERQLDVDKCKIAFTFDDGFRECYTVIAPMLEKFNCNAAFFINSNYIDSDDNYQKNFHNRIKTYTKRPMNWEQVIDLHNRGHVIGAHTLDHMNMAELSDEEIEFQLNENKTILVNRLNYTCDYFAWTYGRLENFPQNALEITKGFHKYIFSGSNHRNYYSYNGDVINRRHIEAFWPKNHIKYFLSVNKKY